MASGKIPGMFQPEALMEAQRRNVEAFTSAGRIVADGLRTAGERQIALMQDAMRNLWGEMQVGAHAKPTPPQEQIDRMRGAFERVMSQVQELSGLLLKVQQEAMGVLNSAANANLKAFGADLPDLVALQKTASEAVHAATRQTASAVEEMRRRMTDLEVETKKAASAVASAPPPEPKKPAAAKAPPPRRGTQK